MIHLHCMVWRFQNPGSYARSFFRTEHLTFRLPTRYMQGLQRNWILWFWRWICGSFIGIVIWLDQCKFLHDRGDYKTGWELEKEWDAEQRRKKQRLEESLKGFGDAEDAADDNGDVIHRCNVDSLKFYRWWSICDSQRRWGWFAFCVLFMPRTLCKTCRDTLQPLFLCKVYYGLQQNNVEMSCVWEEHFRSL